MSELDFINAIPQLSTTTILIFAIYKIWWKYQEIEKQNQEYQKERDRKYNEDMMNFIKITTENVLLNREVLVRLEKMHDNCSQAALNISNINEKIWIK
jgi:hypothetical protein